MAMDDKRAQDLQDALVRLENQAKKTQKSLKNALDLPHVSNLAEEVEQVTKAIDKQIDIRGNLIDQLEDLTKAEKRLADQIAAGGLSAEEATKKTEDLARIKALMAEGNQTLAASNRELAASMSESEEVAALFAETIDKLNAGIPLLPGELAAAKEGLDEFNKAVSTGDTLAENLTDKVIHLESEGLRNLVGAMQQGKGSLQGFASNMMDTTKMGARLGGGLLKLAEASFKFAVEQDKVFSSFRKSTGAGTEFNTLIKETEQVGRIAGVTLGETAAAVGSLKNTFTDFTYLQPQVQKDIMHTTTILNEMGFSMDTQAKIWQTATKSMGLGIQETQQFMLDLAATARGLGVDVNKLGQEFVANTEILSRYGTRATQVFKDMAVQAKATGIEMGKLMGFVDQFKTFDQAGQSVGRLNAIMGGPFLNSIDMLNAAMEDPVEGIRMMKSAIDQAGISAENLSGAEIMAFADALGLSAEDTRKMLSQSNDELDQQSMSMAQAAEEAKNMQNMTDKLTNAFKQLYLDAEPFVSNVLVPMIDGFSTFMGWIGAAISSLGEFGSTALFVGTAVAGLMIATGVGSPFGIAALAVLGTAAVGATMAGEEGEGGKGNALSNNTNLKGYAAGGRHIAGRASTPSSVAVVGENGPELAELGSAANISTASTTERLTKAMEDLSNRLGNLETNGGADAINLAVNIAGEKIDQLVIKSLRSRGAQNMLGPYAGS